MRSPATNSVQAGYKHIEVGVIPEDWEVIRLAELFTFQNGVNADRAAYGKGVPFVNVLEAITHSHLSDLEIPGRVTLPSAIEDSYSLSYGDVLFNRTSETQEEIGLATAYTGSGRAVFGGFVIRGKPKGRRLDSLYSGYALRSPVIRQQIVPMGQGAIRANIGQQNLAAVLFPLPPLPEQRAIAEALSDVDALLTGLDRLIAKKRDLKQAAMQQLLTAQTRLPGFRGEWAASTVGREFEVKLGKMLDAERNSGIPKPYVGNRAVQWNRIDIDGLPTVPMTPEDIDRYRLREGDLLVCEGGDVGRAAIWRSSIECYYQKALHRLRPLRGYDCRLMAELLRLWSARGSFANFVTQTSIAHLPREKFMEMPLPVPPPAEQTAIADVLSDMDAELEALERRREKTRAVKQAMMQQLLTGQIRLVPAA